MGFYLKFMGFLGKKKKGHLGVLLLYCFILLLTFFYFQFFSFIPCEPVAVDVALAQI